MMLARFLQSHRASAIPLFAIAIVPIFGFVGVAVDYSRASSVRTSMQSALDSTALMLSKEAQALTGEQVTQKASQYFLGLFNRPEASNVNVTATFGSPQQGSFILNVASTAAVNAKFVKLFDRSVLNLSASSEVKWGIKRLELALVLDNTGSMGSNGKLAALKTAANNLIDTLQNAAKKPGDVKISIIPFDTRVNVGTANKAATWLDFGVFGVNPDTWTGCVADRTQSHDVQDTTPVVGTAATLFPARNCSSAGLQSLMPLSETWTALHDKINSMTAAGNTNITVGLVWGWHSLTANLPLTQAEVPAPDLDKVIVLLTDGDNTQNRWTTSTSSIDSRTQLACTNIKAAAIKIYTVRVIDGNANLLRNCASSPTMYYDVQEASQLNGVFSSIAQNLANLRIAH